MFCQIIRAEFDTIENNVKKLCRVKTRQRWSPNPLTEEDIIKAINLVEFIEKFRINIKHKYFSNGIKYFFQGGLQVMSISGHTRYTWYSYTRNRSNTIIFRFARKWLIFSYNIFVMLFDWTISAKKKKIVEGRRYFYKKGVFFSLARGGMVALEKRSLGSIHLLRDMCQIKFPFKKLLSNAKSHEKFNLSRKKIKE